MNKNKKKGWLNFIIYALVIVMAIVVIYIVVDNANAQKKINYREFKELVLTDQVAEIDVYGYTVKVRKVDGVKDSDFPRKFDVYLTVQDVKGLSEFIDNYNYAVDGEGNYKNFEMENGHLKTDENGKLIVKDGAVVIDDNYEWETESIFSQLLPWVSVAVVVVLGIFLFKSMSGNSKGFGFGKSKAKLVISSSVRFSDVAGAEEEKQELQEIVEFLKNPTKFTSLGARIPKGVLLVGPPGTGKTLLAKAVAGESKVPFFSISGSDFVELYVGVGASRVRDLFETAKQNAPCIVFIDEIDAVGRQRGAGMGGGNDEREQTLNQMLVEMDGFESNSGIIVLAATNRADVLDPALTRPGRFDRQVYVHLPDVKGREEILKVHARNKPFSDDVDFTRIARLTSGLAGADIENMLNESALLAARDNRAKITMVDITEGLNKVLMGPKKVSRVITENDKRITAIHEAGHAIIAETLENCDDVQEISIIPRGMAGGYTLTFDDNDRTHMTRKKLVDSITMMLGGRSAEETMLDDITTGASNDIERASKLARKMVTEWGLTDTIGLMSFGEGGEVFIGRDYQKQLPYSQELAYKIDQEVKKIIDEAHTLARKILEGKKDLIENIVQILLDKETIYKEEFEMLYNGATVEEVEKSIDKKEKEKAEYQKKAKKQAEHDNKIKELENRLHTAESLCKAGVISSKELENIRSEVNAETEKIKNAENSEEQTKVAQNKVKNDTKKDDKGEN